MSIPRWRPLPSLVGLDARVRGVSHEARGVYLLLVCASDVDGIVHHAGNADAVDALAGPGAGACLDELISFDLAMIDDGELVLPDVPRWQAEHAPRSPAAAPVAPRPAISAPPSNPSTAPEVDRRTASKRLSAQWGKRNLKSADDKTRWLGSESGRTYLEASGISLALATAIATGCQHPVSDASEGVSGLSAGVSADASEGVSGLSAVGFPPVPPSGNQRETTGEERPRGGASGLSAGVSAGSVSGASAVSAERSGPRHGALPQGPSSPSSDLSDQSVDQVLFGLQQRSEGGFTTSGSVDQREAVVRALRDAGVDLDAAGAALREPWVIWPRWERVATQRSISAAMLAGKAPHECAGVGELVKHLRAQTAAPISASTLPTLEETEARTAKEREHLRRVMEERRNGIKMPPFVRRSTAAVESTEVTSG